MDVFERLSLAGLVPILKIENAADAVPLCQALCAGGLPVAEIAFRTDAAESAIRAVHRELPDVILGAGAVRSIDQVNRAMNAGAAYVSTLGFNPKVVSHCIDAGVPILPGCASPADMEATLDMGLTTLTLFPAEALGGVPFLKAVCVPYDGLSFVPTGGIDDKNMMDYLAFPRVRAVGGSWMTPADAIRDGDWERITRLTSVAVNLLLGATLRHVGVNSGTPERAARDAETYARLLGCPACEGVSAICAGDAFELMKRPFRGQNGHIALAVNSVPRAVWYMTRRGFAFDHTSELIENGRVRSIYLKEEIGGFAIHLLQK